MPQPVAIHTIGFKRWSVGMEIAIGCSSSPIEHFGEKYLRLQPVADVNAQSVCWLCKARQERPARSYPVFRPLIAWIRMRYTTSTLLRTQVAIQVRLTTGVKLGLASRIRAMAASRSAESVMRSARPVTITLHQWDGLSTSSACKQTSAFSSMNSVFMPSVV